MKRDIKFDYIFQHEETGRLCSITFNYTEIFNGTAKLQCERLTGYFVVAKRQFIGRTDINKKEIFEGDIVRWDDKSKGRYWRVAKVVINPDIQLVIVKNSLHEISSMFPHTFHWGSFIYTGDGQLEIIGNIYQNPELLETNKAQLSEPKVE